MRQVQPTEADYRRAMAHFTTGVTVVTTLQQGQPYGLTVSAFCSVSLVPLLTLVSLHRTSQTGAIIGQSEIYAVNILGAGQQPLVARFAGKGPRQKTFTDIPHHLGATGAPLFDEALARIECRVVATYPGGDHMLLLGRVVAIECDDITGASEPLLMYRTAFRALRSDAGAGM